MNHGPFIFLGVLASFVASWWALVFAPQLQIGSQQTVQTDGGVFPVRRPGIAQQGREVYVAAGCVQCHSQQVRQEGYTFDVTLTAAGTNAADVAKLIHSIAPEQGARVAEILATASDKAPATILQGVPLSVASSAQSQLTKAGATVQRNFRPLGSDIQRAWGPRRTVAADYLYDQPVQAGNSRLGPDLSHVGARGLPTEWHLLHLYDPRTQVKGSMMPAYQYLFETRPVGKTPSSDALKLPEQFAPKSKNANEKLEVVPKPEALQLVAYLQSLRVEGALFEAPMTPPAPVDAGTNAPAAAATPNP